MKILRFLIIALFVFNEMDGKKENTPPSKAGYGMQWSTYTAAKKQENFHKASQKPKSYWEAEARERSKAPTTVHYQPKQDAKSDNKVNSDLHQVNSKFSLRQHQSPKLSLEEQIDGFADINTALIGTSLTPAQIDFLSKQTPWEWAVHLENLAKSQDHATQIFDFYNFYQFPQFRVLIKASPGYDMAMMSLYNRLDSTSPHFDRNLYDALGNSPAGIGVYECLGTNQFVQGLITQQRMVQAQKLAEELKSTSHEELSQKTLEQLLETKATLATDMTTAYQKLDQLKVDYKKAVAENSKLQAEKGLQKTDFKQNKLDPLTQQYDAIKARLDRLQEQYQRVESYEYLAQNKNEASQERRNALQGKNVTETVTLTNKAEAYLNKLGVDTKTLLYKPANSFQLQSQQEVISLLNNIADHKEQYAITKVDSLFDASAQLARAALNASKYNNAIKTWTLLDASQALCDVAKYGAEKFAQAAEWVALHPGQANEAVGNFAKGVLITGPAQSITKIANAADYVAHNPKQAVKDCAKTLGRLVVLMGYADSLMANDSQGTHHFDSKDLESLGFNLGEQGQALNELTQSVAQLSLNERCEQAGASVGEFVADCIILDGALRVAGNVGKLAVSETTALINKTRQIGLEPLHAIDVSEKLIVDAGQGLTLAIETKQAELVNIVENTLLQNATYEIEFIGVESPLLLTAQEITDLEAACHSLEHECAKRVSVKVATPELQTQTSEYLKNHCESCCKEHTLVLIGNDPARQYHLVIPEELRAVVSTEKNWEKLIKVFDGALTPAALGKQVPIWNDYQHFMGPIINRDCKTGKAFLQGFHHDYLGKAKQSGLIKFNNIVEKSHGFYECHWQYGNIKQKFSTFFPDHWTTSKIMNKVEESLRNPIGEAVWNENKTAKAITGRISEGINIITVFEFKNGTPTGKIISAYPTFRGIK